MPDKKPEIVSDVRLSPPLSTLLHNLGPLQELPGAWHGTGFNLIARPFFGVGNDHFLELNLTHETLKFDLIGAPIPNRGLLQADITLFGVHYLQQISDSFNGGALHIEPGIWVTVPATTNPLENPTVARMASIPHGNALLAQGTASPEVPGPPAIPPANTIPFPIGGPPPFPPNPFPEYTLANPSAFRTTPLNPAITQPMVDDPNSVLRTALTGHTVDHTLTLQVSTVTSAATVPNAGGGIENIAFLLGAAPSNQPNADAAQVTATFWIEKVRKPHGPGHFLQLQYTQTVLLNFNGLSWPHVSVATLRK
jgi:hypothetical protein